MAVPEEYENDVAEVREMIADTEAQELSDDLIYKAVQATCYAYDEVSDEGVTEVTATDHFAAAAVALRLLAARYKTQTDFSSNDQKFSLSQKVKQTLDMAREFDAMSLTLGGYQARVSAIGTISMERSDTWF
jgi:hypothetical protein